jgi:integrase
MKGHTTKRGKTWSFVVDVGPDPATGKRRQRWVSRDEQGRPFTKERDAARAMRDYLGRLESGEPVEQSTDSLAAYLTETWLPSRKSKVRPSTWASYRDVLEGRVIPRIGAVKLRALTPRQVADLYDELLTSGSRDKNKPKGLSSRTVRYTGMVLTRALDDAVKLGLITRNPASQVERPKPATVEMSAWTVDEARRFLRHVDGDRLEALWVLLLTTGLRRGEALGLRWEDVELDAGRLAVRRALVAVGYEVRWSEPKTARSRRVVALDTGTVSALRAHRKAQLEERMMLGAGYSDEGLVFAKVDGSPIHPQTVSQAFERLVKAAGVPAIRLHDTRHTAATLLLDQGVPLKVVSERLGHSSVSITADLYQHVLEHMQTDAAEKAGAVLFGDASGDSR